MFLQKLSDIELVSHTKKLVDEEKAILQQILESLAEIETRRLYAARGFSSLFDFCIKELGYSGSAANRRISSMRLIKTLPEAKEKLNQGSVNLSTLSQLQSFIKREENIKETKLNHKEKLCLLKTIENKSQRECEIEFIKLSPETLKFKESLKPLTEEFVEYKFVASKGLESKLNELRSLLSHQNKSHSTQELIEILADMALKTLEKKGEPRSKVGVDSSKENPCDYQESLSSTLAFSTFTSAAVAVAHHEISISTAEMRRQVYRRDNSQCQFVDPLTKRKCLSRHKIQIDHIYPKALGGGDSLDNLRLLCQAHNLFKRLGIFQSSI